MLPARRGIRSQMFLFTSAQTSAPPSPGSFINLAAPTCISTSDFHTRVVPLYSTAVLRTWRVHHLLILCHRPWIDSGTGKGQQLSSLRYISPSHHTHLLGHWAVDPTGGHLYHVPGGRHLLAVSTASSPCLPLALRSRCRQGRSVSSHPQWLWVPLGHHDHCNQQHSSLQAVLILGMVSPVPDLSTSWQSELANLHPQWLQQPVSIHHDLAVWLSFGAQVRPGARTSQGDAHGAQPSFISPIFRSIMEIFFRSYLSWCRQTIQTNSPSSLPSSPQRTTVEGNHQVSHSSTR